MSQIFCASVSSPALLGQQAASDADASPGDAAGSREIQCIVQAGDGIWIIGLNVPNVSFKVQDMASRFLVQGIHVGRH